MNLLNYILLFFIYAFVGWIIEVIYTKITTKAWVNRGFLIGPLCPIYGFGCIFIITILESYHNDWFVLCIGSMFICSVLEYFTSYVMEKIFHARWWDYSNRKYNLNGRICLETMLPFAVGGTLIVGIINPFILNIINKIPNNILIIIVMILTITYIIDNILSFKVVLFIKSNVKFLNTDNTEEIKRRIKNIFLSKSYPHRRMMKAFPDLFFKKVNLKKLEKKFIKRKRKEKK